MLKKLVTSFFFGRKRTSIKSYFGLIGGPFIFFSLYYCIFDYKLDATPPSIVYPVDKSLKELQWMHMQKIGLWFRQTQVFGLPTRAQSAFFKLTTRIITPNSRLWGHGSAVWNRRSSSWRDICTWISGWKQRQYVRLIFDIADIIVGLNPLENSDLHGLIFISPYQEEALPYNFEKLDPLASDIVFTAQVISLIPRCVLAILLIIW